MEFSVGAYRFGHSEVRPSYRANFGTSATDAAQQFFALFSDHSLTAARTRAICAAECRAPRRFIDWQTFFDFGDGRVRRNKRIDTKLSSVLFKLLGQPADQSDSLATRNLLRGLTMKVPSGQRVARAMGEDVLPRRPRRSQAVPPRAADAPVVLRACARPTSSRTASGSAPSGAASWPR